MKKLYFEVSAEALAAVALFHGMPLHDRKILADKCRGRRFPANHLITSHDDIDNDVYFILSGGVRIAIASFSGREITFRDQCAGEMFGELAALDNRPRSTRVLALAETRAAVMSAENFMWALQLYPEMMNRTLKRLSMLVRLLSHRVLEFSSLNVRSRIHVELLRLALREDPAVNQAMISPAPKHVDLASRISTHREAITREMNQLASSGVIRKDNNRLVINDVTRLETMVMDVAGVYVQDAGTDQRDAPAAPYRRGRNGGK